MSGTALTVTAAAPCGGIFSLPSGTTDTAWGRVVSAALASLNLNTTAVSGRPADEQAWGYDPTGNGSDFTTVQNGNPVLAQHRVPGKGGRFTQIVDGPVSMLLDRSGGML